MKKINILLVIGIGLIILVSGLVIFSDRIDQLFFQKETGTPQENIEESIKQEVVLIIDNGEGEPETFKVEFKEGMTAFDLLKEKTEELNIVLKTKTYDIGIFIEVIGDKENGEEEKYWMYYVNDEMPMVSADKNEIKAGDKVEFKFEKSDW